MNVYNSSFALSQGLLITVLKLIYSLYVIFLCVQVTSKAKGLVRSTDCSKAFTFEDDVTWDILETAALKLEILCHCLVWLSLREWRVDRGENTSTRLPSLRPNSFRALTKRTFRTQNAGNLACAWELRQNYFTPYSSEPYVLLHICVVLRHIMIFHVTRANILLVSASTLKDSTCRTVLHFSCVRYLHYRAAVGRPAAEMS